MNHKKFSSLGGLARAKKLTPEQRTAIAIKGGLATQENRAKQKSILQLNRSNGIPHE